MASSTALSTTSDTSWWRPVVVVEPIYMLGRRRTCSRPSRTWICSAVYATSAPRDLGRLGDCALRAPGGDCALRAPGGDCALRAPGVGSGRGFRTAIAASSGLPAWKTRGDQLGRVSGL